MKLWRNSLLLGLAICSLSYLTKDLYPIEYPESWPKPTFDYKTQSLENNQVQLGRKLFYDPRLSKDSSQSCESCHSPYNAFAHTDHTLSHGIYDSIGTRNAPALFNLAWQKSFMWDGSVSSLKNQARFPISHPSEMGFNLPELIKRLEADSAYTSEFQLSFKKNKITEEQILLSLQSFMLTLISKDSKYDLVKAGLDSFSEMESKGYQLFKANCNSCHTEPLFSNYSFANNGLPVDDRLLDSGRYRVSKNKKDLFKFKIPSLRNLEYSYPYMHDGRFANLYQVLAHYSHPINQEETLDFQLRNGIQLTADQKTELVAFLLTLNDKKFVFNREFGFPRK